MKEAFVKLTNINQTLPWRNLLNLASFPFGLCFRKSDGQHLCLICFKSFGLRKNALKHVRVSHDNLKKAPGGELDPEHTGPYLCHCGVGLKTKSKLRYHIMSVHQKKIQYACPQCSAPFVYKSTADNHIANCEGDPQEASKMLRGSAICHPAIEPSFALFALLQDVTTRLTIDILTGIQQSKIDLHFLDFLSQGEEKSLKAVLKECEQSTFLEDACSMAVVDYVAENDPAIVHALRRYLNIFVTAIFSKRIMFQSVRRYTGDGFEFACWGLGVFAKENILKGQIITELHGHLRGIPKQSGDINQYSVIVLEGKSDKLLTGPSSFINHHCTKFNVAYNLLEGQQSLNVRTQRDIEKGEEIFANYGPLYFPRGSCQCHPPHPEEDISTFCASIIDIVIDETIDKS